MELSPRNWQAWEFYRQAKAAGLSEAERTDPIVRKCFAVLDPIIRAVEAKQDAGFVAVELAKLFSQLKESRP